MNSKQLYILLGFFSVFLSSGHGFLVCEFDNTQNTSNYGSESTTSSVWPTRSFYTF